LSKQRRVANLFAGAPRARFTPFSPPLSRVQIIMYTFEQEKTEMTVQRGLPQPKKLNHGFHGFHGLNKGLERI
jgi:hypothetical protein